MDVHCVVFLCLLEGVSKFVYHVHVYEHFKWNHYNTWYEGIESRVSLILVWAPDQGSARGNSICIWVVVQSDTYTVSA